MATSKNVAIKIEFEFKFQVTPQTVEENHEIFTNKLRIPIKNCSVLLILNVTFSVAAVAEDNL